MKLIQRTHNGVEIECKDYTEFLALCEVMSFVKTTDNFYSSYDTLMNEKILLKIKDRKEK